MSTQRACNGCISGREKVYQNRLFPILPSVLLVKETEVRRNAEVTEQDSTTVPKSAYLRFCPFGKSCWGVPSPNPAMRLVPLENPTKKYLKNRLQNGGK